MIEQYLTILINIEHTAHRERERERPVTSSPVKGLKFILKGLFFSEEIQPEICCNDTSIGGA